MYSIIPKYVWNELWITKHACIYAVFPIHVCLKIAINVFVRDQKLLEYSY